MDKKAPLSALFYPLKILFFYTFYQNPVTIFLCISAHSATNIAPPGYPPCLILRKFAFEGAPVFLRTPSRDLDTPTVSETVLRVHIFLKSLPIMARLTKWLPVTFIPKQDRISPMRFNVINNGCFHKPSFFLTPDTQRM